MSKQDAELKAVQSERDALAGQLEGMRAKLDTAASLAEHNVSLNWTPSNLHKNCELRMCLEWKIMSPMVAAA